MVKKSEGDLSSTENRILDAAKKVFIAKGFNGTSMQQIATEAGIHKSLLHYYFRSKDKLFTAVFVYAFQHFVPQIQEILISDASVSLKIERIINEYMDMLMQNEFIPSFILHEINRDPDRLYEIMLHTGINPSIFLDQFTIERTKGNMRQVDPRHLLVNILSLCIFPIAARPLIQRVFFSNDNLAYNNFLRERKSVVTKFIIQSIQV